MRMPGSGLLSFAALLLIITWVGPSTGLATSLDQLSDLTGKATAIVTLKGRDNFTSEYRYDVSVRNNSSDSFIADSLVLVLDKVTNLAGEDREPLKNESFLQRFEVLDQDGETDDGKPFFRVPTGSSPDLGPHSDSRAATVRLRNRDYVAVFTPSFRVLGLKRPPAKPKPPEPPPQISENTNAIDKLLQLLIKKGLITDEEARSLKRP
jgi:hypothetical protein